MQRKLVKFASIVAGAVMGGSVFAQPQQDTIFIDVDEGELRTVLADYFGTIYPGKQVLLEKSITGVNRFNTRVSGSSSEELAVKVLKGLNLQGCIYRNNVIALRAKVDKPLCEGEKSNIEEDVPVTVIAKGWFEKTDRRFDVEGLRDYGKAAAQTGQMPLVTDPNDTPMLADSTDEVVSEQVHFQLNRGLIKGQIEKLLADHFIHSPSLVWQLDENEMWPNAIKVSGATYDHILARLLKSYGAAAYFYDNNFVVVKKDN